MTFEFVAFSIVIIRIVLVSGLVFQHLSHFLNCLCLIGGIEVCWCQFMVWFDNNGHSAGANLHVVKTICQCICSVKLNFVSYITLNFNHRSMNKNEDSIWEFLFPYSVHDCRYRNVLAQSCIFSPLLVEIWITFRLKYVDLIVKCRLGFVFSFTSTPRFIASCDVHAPERPAYFCPFEIGFLESV